MKSYVIRSVSILLMILAYSSPLSASEKPVDELAIYQQVNHPERLFRDEIIYFVMLDRFANGDPENDKGGITGDRTHHGFDPASENYYHGGDIAGLTSKLPYLKKLGVTSIWLTPVFKNHPIHTGTDLSETGSYHGYWIKDFLQVDPHLGTADDLRKLVAEAHQTGIKVILDIVLNHTFDAIKYRECHHEDGTFSIKPLNLKHGVKDVVYYDCRYLSHDSGKQYTPFLPVPLKNAKSPAWLNNPAYYHNRGDSSFAGESALFGDFNGGDDLDTANPQVIEGMIDITKFWMREFDIDGFRVDTVKNVDRAFWQVWNKEVRRYARELGKNNFAVFGEAYEFESDALSQYQLEADFPSLLDFRFQSTVRSILGGGLTTAEFDRLFIEDDYFTEPDRDARDLVNFLGNHDVGRFSYLLTLDNENINPKELLALTRLGYSLMFSVRGIPLLLYGDEQGFIGDGADKFSRADMFPSRTPVFMDDLLLGTAATPADDNFDTNHPLFKYLQDLTGLYKNHSVLRRGRQFQHVSDKDNGVFAFSRYDPQSGDEILIAYNFSQEKVEKVIEGQSGSFKTLFTESISGHSTLDSDKGGIRLKLAPLSVAFFKAESSRISTAKLQKAKISEPAAHQVVSGRVKVNLEQPFRKESGLTDFKYRLYVTNEGEDIYLGEDVSLPYQFFWNASVFPDGTHVSLKAIASSGGHSETTEIPVLVDTRLPDPLVLNIENGNRREKVFIIDDLGNVESFYSKKGDSLLSERYRWHPDAQQITILKTDIPDGSPRLDVPLTLTRSELVQASEEGTNGKLTASLFINNLGKITKNRANFGGVQPEVWSMDRTLDGLQQASGVYLRGAMNGWGIGDEMVSVSPGLFTLSRLLESGDTEFKFADQDWKHINLGAPFKSGLMQGGGSGNLRATIPATERYHFYLLADAENPLFFYDKDLGPLKEMTRLILKGQGYYLSKPLHYIGEGEYQVELSGVPEDNYELHFESDVTGRTFGVAGDFELNKRNPLANGTKQSGINLKTGDYSLSLKVTDKERSVFLTSKKKEPDYGIYAKQMYLRGNMNGWQALHKIDYLSANQYHTLVFLEVGDYEFKIADENWHSQRNLGGSKTNQTVFPDQKITLSNMADSSNLQLKITVPGVYSVSLDANEPETPVLLVRPSDKSIVHYYLPNLKQWDTQYVEVDDGMETVEMWYIDQIGTSFNSLTEAESAKEKLKL